MNDFKYVSSMDSGQRTPEFQKNQVDEEFIDSVNSQLSPIESNLRQYAPKYPKKTILITGVPRSGTTFLYQLMASKLPCAYVSNLMARFYQVPLTGAWLQSRLISDELSELHTLESVNGVTKRVYEPHEYGYFWSSFFPFQHNNHQDIDKNKLRRKLEELEYTLQAVSGILEKPVIYKCMLAPFILDELFTNTSIFVVHLVRDRSDVIRSILKTRELRLGSIKNWWSIRPSGWTDILNQSPREQVEWQYDEVFKAIQNHCSYWPDRNIEIEYAKLASSPEHVLEEILAKYSSYTG